MAPYQLQRALRSLIWVASQGSTCKGLLSAFLFATRYLEVNPTCNLGCRLPPAETLGQFQGMGNPQERQIRIARRKASNVEAWQECSIETLVQILRGLSKSCEAGLGTPAM